MATYKYDPVTGKYIETTDLETLYVTPTCCRSISHDAQGPPLGANLKFDEDASR